VVPSNPVEAAPEAAVPLAEPDAEDGTADDARAADELPSAAGGVVVLLLAHADRPASSATAATAPSQLVVRTVVLTCALALIPPRRGLGVQQSRVVILPR